MLITRQNRLLPILAGTVVLMLVVVLAKSCGQSDSDTATLSKVPTATRPDADTPADTIETLTANVAAMTTELERLRETNSQLRSGNEELATHKADIKQLLEQRLQEALTIQDGEAPTDEALAILRQRVDALADALSASHSTTDDFEMPVGLGLPSTMPSSELTWIEPLDGPGTGLSDALIERVGRQRQGDVRQSVRANDQRAAEATDVGPIPVYTVPRNATLIGATAMTALLGRVPVRGEVRDPMPFKVITGRNNLAANGLGIPNVHGMIWSGTAIGDWTLSCVTGKLESVTFVFDDGTIRTLASDGRDGGDSRGDRPLGWISDAHGIPCITGERKSNAAAFLSQRFGVKLMEAAAQAAAAAETTTVIRDSGAVTNSVAGDNGDYILGKTLAGGTQEIAAWLAERQAQHFDAVFVAAGRELAIHVDRELTIDLDPKGRRLAHDNDTTAVVTGGLD